ncbi:MAG: sugar kinase [Deltaproteobacteria bacterium]|nr:sugar kinase [Deltaproteobacteria bacterium]
MSITVVGTVAFDDVVSPFGKIANGLGGSATHFSVAASFFTTVKLVAVVGGDFPREHIDFFKSRKIDLEGLKVIPDGKTFKWVGSYGDDLNDAKTLETQLNVIANFKPEIPETYKNNNVLFLANIDPDQQIRVIQNAGKPGLIALDTMNLWLDIKKDAVIKAIKMVDLVTINEYEVRQLTGCHNMVDAAGMIRQMGPKIVVIKRGGYGALMFYQDQVFSAPAMPLKQIYDPTGAGDSFAGGMVGYLDLCGEVNLKTLKTAVICGSVMASFNVEKFSCERLKEINRDDIIARFKVFEDLVVFDGLKY